MTKPARPERAQTDWQSDAMRRRIQQRYGAERRFRLFGLGAVAVSAGFLAFLLISMLSSGLGGFNRTEVALPLDLKSAALEVTPEQLASPGADLALASAGLADTVETAALAAFGETPVPVVSEYSWLAVRDAIKADPSLIAKSTRIDVPVSSEIEEAVKGDGTPEAEAIAKRLDAEGVLNSGFNWQFLSASDSTDPSAVGIWGALKGSFLTMLVTLALAFPIGVFSAVYLEEYAPKNRWTDLIEVSINNLAAVPSIIFGLLGLAVFLNTFNLPRSAPIVGGLTLALMIMPVIVIAGRNAIKAVPPSIRDAALGIGASRVQVVFHHVIPLALPGIMTGTIIGMARALGETAPLLMIGMRAFIVSPPEGLSDPATVLPVQIFLWSDQISRGFIEKTSAAIIVLLVFLLAMNAFAIYLRNRFETRW